MSTSRKVGPFRVRPHILNGRQTGKWFVDIPAPLTSSGRRKRKLFANQRTALEVARQLKRRLDPITGHVLPKTHQSNTSFRQAADLWQVDEELRVQTLEKSASTLEADIHRMKSLRTFFGEHDITAITDRHLMEYKKWRLDQGRKPRTINTELGTLSLVLRWAQKEGHISDVPKTKRIPVRRTPAVIPTPREVVRIIQELPPRLRPLVRFLAETGCRKGEALNLTWDCVDEVGGYVDIRSHDDWTPKTNQSERRIPLNPSLLKMICDLPKKGRYVFPGKNPKKPIGHFRRALKTAVVNANIRRDGNLVHLTPQSFRKAHATWQAERGVNESVLQDLLGHAPGSSVTKQYYIHTTEEAKRGAVIELPTGKQN